MNFFAEGLPRLGVINLQLSLRTTSTSSTTLSTTSHNATAVLLDEGQQVNILLPLDASVTETFSFPAGKSVVTARIPCLATNINEDVKALISADDFQGGRRAEVCCSVCYQQVFRDREMRWKDLPSDSWVEYSDYWLCHPHPHSHDGDTHSHSHANSQPLQLPTIKAMKGTALIGLTSLLLHPQDIQSPTKVPSPCLSILFPFQLAFPNYWTQRKYPPAIYRRPLIQVSYIKLFFKSPSGFVPGLLEISSTIIVITELLVFAKLMRVHSKCLLLQIFVLFERFEDGTDCRVTWWFVSVEKI